MKNVFKIALVAVIGFSMAALSLTGCDLSDLFGDDNTDSTTSLDGVWGDSSGMRITVSGNTAVINAFGSLNPLWTDAKNKNHITVGGQYWRTINSTGNLTWSGEQLLVSYNSLSPNVATGTKWGNATFTLSADGQTLTETGADSSGNFTLTWTRK